MRRRKKPLDYYLGLEYAMEFQRVPDDQGGGFVASIPRLGRASCVGYGKSLAAAHKSLMVAKEEVIKEAYELGEQEKLEPGPDLEAYSGVFLVRTTRELHHALATQAEAQSVSLNHLAATLLAAGTSMTNLLQAVVRHVAQAGPANTIDGAAAQRWRYDDLKAILEEPGYDTHVARADYGRAS